MSSLRLPAATYVLVIASFCASGCSDDPGDGPASTKPTPERCINAVTQLDCKAQLAMKQVQTGKALTEGALLELPVGAMAVGGQLNVDLQVTNVAALTTGAALRIEKVRLDPIGADAKAFECLDVTGTKACADVDWKALRVAPAGGEDPARGLVSQHTIRIRYKHQGEAVREAKLCLSVVGDPLLENKDFCVQFKTTPGKAKLLVTPSAVGFPYVQAGNCDTLPVTLTNVGDAPLFLHRIDFSGDVSFAVKDGDKVLKPGQPLVFSPSLELQKGASRKIDVLFCPSDESKRSGTLLVQSSDPSAPASGIPVQLLGNAKVPCLKVLPHPVLNFGAVILGNTQAAKVTISSCGSEPVELTSVSLSATGSDNFKLDWSETAKTVPGLDPKTGPTVAAPIKLAVNAVMEVKATYSPSKINPLDAATGSPTPDLSSVLVVSSDLEVTVQLQGIGVQNACPQAKILIKEGEEVVPQTVLHFKGDQSVAPGGGSISKYLWKLKKVPEGAKVAFLPSPTHHNPALAVNAAGEYVVCLEVTDDKGAKSGSTQCPQETCITILVIPNEALHVELLWKTPGDPDETNTGAGAGADMDLHFAHAFATGPDLDCDGTGDPWFHGTFDAFWYNVEPNWGSAKLNDDNPSLDLDDTDGAGPENLNLDLPEGTTQKPMTYSIGVHHWNDHGYGVSFATVKVFVLGVLVFEQADVELKPKAMWHVGKLNWPNDKLGVAGAPPVMQECLQSGDACLGKKDPSNPKGGKMWETKGNKCVTPCYSSPLAPQIGGGGC